MPRVDRRWEERLYGRTSEPYRRRWGAHGDGDPEHEDPLPFCYYDDNVSFISSTRPYTTPNATMSNQGLGDFEQLVMLAIVHLGGESYGVPIVDEIERRTGRAVARAAVYVTLRRLEDKGFVLSRMSEPTAERGGKGRRIAKILPAGARALRDARATADRMWRGLDPATLKAR